MHYMSSRKYLTLHNSCVTKFGGNKIDVKSCRIKQYTEQEQRNDLSRGLLVGTISSSAFEHELRHTFLTILYIRLT